MSYILDADFVIHALAGRTDVITIIEQLLPQGISISLVTVGEIYEGAFGLPDPQAQLEAFRQFLSSFQSLTLTDPIMERFAAIRSTLRQQGKIIPDFDILLAATALHYDLTVLTFNYKHLSRIPGLTLYQPS